MRNLQTAIDRTYLEFRGFKFRKQSLCKVPLYLEGSRYRVKSIESRDELEQVLRLRYEVFIRDGLDRRRAIQIDFDRFDFRSDHLAVLDKSDRIVGTYRLLLDEYSDRFYSESEFKLKNFLALTGKKLEMGRACIHPAHRNGVVITMLWRAIYQYMSLTKARYLFGCTSFKLKTGESIFKTIQSLDELQAFDSRLKVEVKSKFRYELKSLPDRQEKSGNIPSLARAYLKAGAKLSAEPAYDANFKCFDFFTVLDLEKLNQSYHRYGK